jgi:hypothetical protein
MEEYDEKTGFITICLKINMADLFAGHNTFNGSRLLLRRYSGAASTPGAIDLKPSDID